MALRTILTDEDELLRKVSREITQVDDRIQELIDDMIETMYENHGIGLAAVQFGVLRRLLVMDIQDGNGPYILINPQIVSQKGTQVGQEGCLSVPGRWGDVERPEKVVFKALDRTGKPIKLKAEGLLAVCACHEFDHLNGTLFTDKVTGELIRS